MLLMVWLSCLVSAQMRLRVRERHESTHFDATAADVAQELLA
jgi:hypothetical protein